MSSACIMLPAGPTSTPPSGAMTATGCCRFASAATFSACKSQQHVQYVTMDQSRCLVMALSGATYWCTQQSLGYVCFAGRQARCDQKQRHAEQQEGREDQQQVHCAEEQRHALPGAQRCFLPPQVVGPPIQGGQGLRVLKGWRQRLHNEEKHNDWTLLFKCHWSGTCYDRSQTDSKEKPCHGLHSRRHTF